MTDRLAATLSFDAPVAAVAGVSSARAAALSSMGIHTVRDLLSHYPRRYLDMSRLTTIAQARIGENATIVATVHEAVVKRPKPKLDLTEVTLVDGTGTLIATFFRQPWLAKTLTPGTRVSVAGEVEFNYGFKRMTVPFLDKLDIDEAAHGRVIPVHGASEKVPAGQMRRLVANALDIATPSYDPLPLELRTKYRLISRNAALHAVHFPSSMEEAAAARRRLAYEEVLLLELHLMRESAQESAGAPAHEHVINGAHLEKLRKAVPFALTDDQRRSVDDILKRMAAPGRMEHMLLGDVRHRQDHRCGPRVGRGSRQRIAGAHDGPHEVLAAQYAASLGPLLDAAGVPWALIMGSTPQAERDDACAALASGSLSVAFGTHALLEDSVTCKNCSLVIVDEEQRFGVDQRAKLAEKGRGADVLLMTATPIPRSLALALYGSMTQSYLRQVPFDRPPRTTRVLGFRERGRAYDAALAACERGEQAYGVCPLVGEEKARGREARSRRCSGRGTG